ncbi:MAG: hypothetical protein F9K31_11385 [Dokdonella sp.]|nr:MAG: hypothetical protein F9K31_11385 [Dokdonella sp.]
MCATATRSTRLLTPLLLALCGSASAIDEYRLDDGVKESGIGLQPANDYSLAWLNRFVIQSGHETIHAVNVAFGGSLAGTNIPNGTPLTVYVWYDANQDGAPDHDPVIASGTGVVANSGSNALTSYALTQPATFQPGDIIFAGVIITYSGNPQVASIDTDGIDGINPYPPADHSFIASNWATSSVPLSPIDPAHLAWAQNPVNTVRNALYGGNADGNWMIRLNASTPGAPLPVVTPTAIDMGDIDMGTSSLATINLANVGTATWQVLLYVPMPDPTSGPFELLPGTCGLPPFQVSPGTSCDIEATFAPVRHGSHVVSVEIAGNTPPGTVMFTLKGIGSIFASGFE